MKKILSIACMLLIALTTLAQKSPNLHAVFQQNGILTVYYDANEPEGENFRFIDWNGDQFFPNESVHTVIFDESIKNYRPKSCKNWFANCQNLTEIKGLEYLNTSEVTDMSGMFFKCFAIVDLDLRHFDTRKVTDMSEMFAYCRKLQNINITSFDTRNVVNMNKMFHGCELLNTANINNLNYLNVKDTTQIFDARRRPINEVIYRRRPNFPSWDALANIKLGDCSNYASKGQAVSAKGLTNIPEGYSVASFRLAATVKGFTQDAVSNSNNITDQQRMIISQLPYGSKFYIEDIKLKNDKENFIVSGPTFAITIDNRLNLQDSIFVKIENKTATYYYGEQVPNSINVNKIRNIDSSTTNKISKVIIDKSLQNHYPKGRINWFSGLRNLTEIVDMDKYLNTDSVNDMSNMFFNCGNLKTINVSNFKTANVADMQRMFAGCRKLEKIDLSSFDFSNVRSLSEMFAECNSLKRIEMRKTNIDTVSYNDIFFHCYLLESSPFENFFRDSLKYGDELAIVSDFYYRNKTKEQAEPYAILQNSVLTFYYGQKPANAFSINDITPLSRNEANVEYSILQQDKSVRTPEWSYVANMVQKVIFDPSFKDYRPKSCYEWFAGFGNLTEIVGMKENLNTQNVKRFSAMFMGCAQLKSLDLSGFDTQNATDMHSMFLGCSSLQTLDLSSFDTQNVISMAMMFDNCTSLTNINLSSFNTSAVTNMGHMFFNCKSLKTIDLSTFRTLRCENMSFMFAESGITNIDVSRFDTRGIEGWAGGLSGIFMNCKNLKTLDVSNFTGNYYNGMFFGCSSLKSIKLFASGYYEDGYYVNPGEDMSGMFYGCQQLKTIDLTPWNKLASPRSLQYMFANCTKLKKIYVSHDWFFEYIQELEVENLDGTIETKTIEDSHNNTNIFQNCPKLSGGKGTKWTANNQTDNTLAHPDGGKEHPGYFSLKQQ